MDGYTYGYREMTDGSEVSERAAWPEIDADSGEAGEWMGARRPCASHCRSKYRARAPLREGAEQPGTQMNSAFETLSDGCVLLGRILTGMTWPLLEVKPADYKGPGTDFIMVSAFSQPQHCTERLPC